MRKKQENLTQEELNLIEETDRFMKEVNADPEVTDAKLPPEVYENLMKKVAEKKATCDANAEREELVRLGRIYKRRKKARKYWVIAAAAVLALALGITSIGGGEKLMECLRLEGLGKDQSQTNTEGAVTALENISEEEFYQWFEDEYGVYPVVMLYRPKEVNFLEAKKPEDTNAILVNYDKNGRVKIVCRLYPNYNEASHGEAFEENMIEEYQMTIKNCLISVGKYQVEENEEQRWGIDFVYKNVRYKYILTDVHQDEVEKIVKNLYF